MTRDSLASPQTSFGVRLSRIHVCGEASDSLTHLTHKTSVLIKYPGGGGHSHTLPIRVYAAQRGRDFEAPDLEWGIHFRGVF